MSSIVMNGSKAEEASRRRELFANIAEIIRAAEADAADAPAGSVEETVVLYTRRDGEDQVEDVHSWW